MLIGEHVPKIGAKIELDSSVQVQYLITMFAKEETKFL